MLTSRKNLKISQLIREEKDWCQGWFYKRNGYVCAWDCANQYCLSGAVDLAEIDPLPVFQKIVGYIEEHLYYSSVEFERAKGWPEKQIVIFNDDPKTKWSDIRQLITDLQL